MSKFNRNLFNFFSFSPRRYSQYLVLFIFIIFFSLHNFDKYILYKRKVKQLHLETRFLILFDLLKKKVLICMG